MKQYVVKYIIPEDYDVSDKPDRYPFNFTQKPLYFKHLAESSTQRGKHVAHRDKIWAMVEN